MRKIKVIFSTSGSTVERDVNRWVESEDAKGWTIISVTGSITSQNGNIYTLTYILCEKDNEQKTFQLNS